MTALLGLLLFFFGLGLVTGLMIPRTVIVILIAGVCLLCGYLLFCK